MKATIAACAFFSRAIDDKVGMHALNPGIGPHLIAGILLGIGSIGLAREIPSTSPKHESAGPVEVDIAVFDFGWIMVDADVHHVFRLKNLSETEVRFRSAIPDSSFVSVERYPTSLAPGATEDVAVRVQGQKAPASFDATITLTLDDAKKSIVKLRVQGQRPSIVQVNPPVVEFAQVTAGQPTMRIVRISNRGTRPMHPTLAPLKPNGPFAAGLHELSPGGEFELVITTSEQASAGQVESEIVVSTDLPQVPEIRIPVSATFLPGFELIPGEIFAPSGKGKGETTELRQSVWILNKGRSKLKIDGAACDDPRIRVTVDDFEPGKLYRVLVEFPEGYELPRGVTHLTLKSMNPGIAELRIPILNRADEPIASKIARPPARRPPAMDFVGRPAPEFRLATNIPGVEISNAELGNWPVTVLNFVAPNCGFCKRQLPGVEAARREFETYGIRFVNVSQTMKKQFTPEEAVREYSLAGSSLEVAIDPQNKVGLTFDARSYPTLFVIGSDGIVRDVIVGAKPNMQELLGRQLWPLIDGTSPALRSNP